MIIFCSASGSHGNVSGASQTGDTLGKALASVSTRHLNPIRAAHLCPCYAQAVRSGHKTRSLETQRNSAKLPPCSRNERGAALK